MVEVDGELLIAAQLIAHERSDRLLVGGAQDKLAVMAVLESYELFAVCVDAAALTPKLSIDHDGHHEFLGIMAVHLIANDVLNLANGAPGKRKIGIETCCLFANHAGTEKEAMTRKLRLGRIFL